MKCEICGRKSVGTLCHWCIKLKVIIKNNPENVRKLLRKIDPHFKRLEAIERKIEEFDRHSAEATYIELTGIIRGDHSGAMEEKFAWEAITEAVLITRGVSPEKAKEIIEKHNIVSPLIDFAKHWIKTGKAQK